MGAQRSPGVRIVVPRNRWVNFGGSLKGAQWERWAYKRDLASRALTLTNHLMKKNEAV